MTFGEMPAAAEVKGLRIHAESAGGTLHAQCVLRGFDPASAEEVTMAAVDITTPGTIELLFSHPLAVAGSFLHYTVEPWLVWTGETPLVLSQIPTIIS